MIPNKAFDIEYGTQYRKEYIYLLKHGIEPSFIKHTKDYNIPIYKYKKTPELFFALYMFYEAEKNSKQYDKLMSMLQNAAIKVDGNFGDKIEFGKLPELPDSITQSFKNGDNV